MQTMGSLITADILVYSGHRFVPTIFYFDGVNNSWNNMEPSYHGTKENLMIDFGP